MLFCELYVYGVFSFCDFTGFYPTDDTSFHSGKNTGNNLGFTEAGNT